MRIVIAVATANATLRAYLAANRNAVLPPEYNGRGYLKDARFSVQVHAIDHQTTPAVIGVWLRRLAVAADGLIMLIDDARRDLAADYEDAYFVVGVPAYPGKVLQNQFRSTIAPILRHFTALSQRFDNLRNQRALLLPLEIFLAGELVALRTRLTTNKMIPGLGEDLDRLLLALNQRARPKVRQRFRQVYLVDDRPLWYRYGPERHGVVETTMPPHHEKCWHNSRFRFGRLFNDRLHHNVDDDSKPTRVFGNFVTCHGGHFGATGESHLNIFPNGYL
jgi:hypothetical protein